MISWKASRRRSAAGRRPAWSRPCARQSPPWNCRPAPFSTSLPCAHRLGVSRFPVSEALSRLQAEGLVQIQPQRGSIVSLIRLADARENMFLRRSLEVEAVRSLAPIATQELLRSLRAISTSRQSALAADDRARFHRLDLAFHDMLLDALGFHKVKQSGRLRANRPRPHPPHPHLARYRRRHAQ